MRKLIAVADTTPLHYLIEIGQIEVLSHLFSSVLIPRAVLAELTHDSTPGTIRKWLSSPPVWLNVVDVTRTRQFPAALNAGECEAMELALSVPCDLILMDEKAGRKVATRLGLNVMGTLGLLERADELGLVEDLETPVTALRSTNIRVSDSLVTQLLERHRKRTSG